MRVVAVSLNPTHSFHKENYPSITLLTGIGVEGDAHAGPLVKHRSRVRKDPSQPNLRQVHLLHQELLEELTDRGFYLKPGQMGENILTLGVPLLELPRGSKLRFGPLAEVEITGLRNPCTQLDDFQPGLMQAVLGRDPKGNLVRRSGIMGVVTVGGPVKPGDGIKIFRPEGTEEALRPV